MTNVIVEGGPDSVSVVVPPSSIKVSYDVGRTGRRGSVWFSGSGAPGPLTLPEVELFVNDMYMDSASGWIWQYVLLPNNTADWVKAYQASAGGGGGGAVSSVAGRAGDVVLTVADLTDAASLATDAELASGLAGKADTTHTHAPADITGTAVITTDPRLSDARTPTAHTHTASQISDSTATGRSVLTATDAAAARTAIGAGTSSLAIGTTGTTAAAGNRQATTTGTGMVELATTAETTTGTDTTRAVTPAGLKAVADTKADTSHNHDTAYVPLTRTVNSKALSANVTLTAADVGAASASHTHAAADLSGVVKTVNGTAPDAAGNIVVTSETGVSDHGALTGLSDDDHPQYLNQTRGDARYSLTGHNHDTAYVPQARTVNGKALSANISLTATDVGAATTAHTHTIGNVTNLQTTLDGKAATSHSHAVADVTGLQTALDGKAASSHTHAAGDVTSGTLNIARIPTGTTGTTVALGNHTHNYAATSHTHAIGDVTNLQTNLDGKAPLTHTHVAGDITAGVFATARLGTGTANDTVYLRGDGTWAPPPAGGGTGTSDHGALTGLTDDDHPQYLNNARGDVRYAAVSHSHTIANVTNLQSALDGKASTSHNHDTAYTPLTRMINGKALSSDISLTASDVGAAATSHSHAAGDITGTLNIARIPTGTTSATVALGNHTHTAASIGAAAVSHNHIIGDTTGLQAALDSKAATGHTHAEYAAVAHTHTIANITNLQSSLDAKVDKSSTKLVHVGTTAPSDTSMVWIDTTGL